jgi:hypothetical protein
MGTWKKEKKKKNLTWELGFSCGPWHPEPLGKRQEDNV